MIYIAICDDENMFRTNLRRCIEANTYLLEESVQIIEYKNAQEIMEYLEQKLDLLFLDIEMPGINGMEFMRKYGEYLTNTKVIFVTFYDSFILKGYEVNAYRFLIKPVTVEQIAEIFKAYKAANILNRSITIIEDRIPTDILLRNIIFIESHNNKIGIRTKTTYHCCYQKIKEVSIFLPDKYFYQIHRSYIVNMTYVERIDKCKNIVILTNGETVLISRSKKIEFEKSWLNFLWEEF